MIQHPCVWAVAACLVALGCSDSDPGSGGSGDLRLTSWGEEYIEQGIPAGDAGFADTWAIRFERFLVGLGGVEFARSNGGNTQRLPATWLIDHVVPGIKELERLSGIRAGKYAEFAYEIVVPSASTTLGAGVSEADRTRFIENDYTVWLSGVATKGDVEKRFEWGFSAPAALSGCASDDGTPGFNLVSGGSEEVELTIHGDHFFYDRLTPNDANPTSLRFEPLARADRDENGDVTLAELEATTIDVDLYDPSPFDATNHASFLRELSRSVAHFRGEGECTIGEP